MTKFQKNCQIIAKCEHEFYSTLCKVCTWVLLNTLLQFHEFFLTLCIFVVFYNVNTVRSEMWVWGFPNHSCQKFLTNHSSSTRDLTRFLAFVIWKTPYSHFLLTVFSHSWPYSSMFVIKVGTFFLKVVMENQLDTIIFTSNTYFW